MRDKPFSDQIRDAVNGSGRTRYSICKAIGFNEGAMSRFMSGQSGISLAVLDRLAEILGMEVTTRESQAREEGLTDGIAPQEG